MLNRKRLVSRLAFLYFVFVLLFLIGCSGTNTIIREVPIYLDRPALRDSIVLRDSVIYKDSVAIDSLWYGEVQDSLGKVIGDLKVYFKTKIAELKLNAKKDTVWYVDTVEVNNASNSILPVVVNSFEWWEKIILFGGLGLIISFLTYLRIKRGKII